MRCIVGSTGFVGSNLVLSGAFDEALHSSNIQEAYGRKPELLVYAGVRAAKFLANKDAEADWQQVHTAIENIERIAPRRLVLISTVDVYPVPADVDESSEIDEAQLAPYGRNRYRLEQWVRENVPGALVVRLPGLFGRNLRKNFLYDLLTVIPAMLSEGKYAELAARSSLVAESYSRQANGFYACGVTDAASREGLKQEFMRLGFTAMNFTDSRGVFQFYDLRHLWGHIEAALAAGISLLNIATEPVRADEIYRFLYGKDFVNELDRPVPHYDYRTQHTKVLGGENGYIFSHDEVLADIRRFVEGWK